MLLVIAPLEDPGARQLVRWLGAEGVASRLLLCPDLARPGWRLELGVGDAGPARAVVGGEVFEASAIRGVVTRLWAVTALELPFIHAEDRAYAAAEMHAFLLAFLVALRCPVLNAPSPGCLAGPNLSHEQWLQLAHTQQLKTRALQHKSVYGDGAPVEPSHPLRDAGPMRDVTVVGTRCFGAPSAEHADAALRLARAAGVELLRVVFSAGADGPPAFLHADYWIDAANPAIAGAIRERCSA